MSRFDEDMHPRVVSGPPRFNFAAYGAVYAVPVVLDGRTVAYIFHGGQDEPDSAGVITTTSGALPPHGSKHWSDALQRSKAAGVPAADAVRSLLGAVGPEGAGVVGTELRRYDGKAVLDAELNPHKAAPAPRRDAPQSSRELLDAALRGEREVTRDIRAQVERLDTALSAKPTPDALLVALTGASARIPDELRAGTRVFERSFLPSYLAKTGVRFAGIPLVVWLRVPAGTPALFTEPALPGDPGVLLLGRGIEWEVDRVIDLEGQKVVTARVVDRRPDRI